ncbi:hypothetical protein [Trichocoleus sp. FACHB-262]|uniref:hypothetical protein n=1 Tax=Trichocoleus sp. FACHB-262 TaxID=2692869 RepID=UPI001688363C|nr:hypothetical protein [Trichocoleus sp. FACHB-262]MBD2124753.1 hypothetical protein [Trichocoleus sp. FACHB-262]
MVQFKEHLKAQGLAPTSVNRALAGQELLKLARYPHALEFNPAPAVAMEKVPELEAHDLLPIEVQALL